ncbi:hypothetical protein GE09DRAFT_1223169 [Coniochaeta sp. 2T2.1]|nr:hypothetical protein GE09DRAFT_1223169 [Coniochaeta sp. 2T2.1]
MEYTIDMLQTDEEGVRFYLKYYKPFRLLALQLSPEAFTSTYAEWSAFEDDAWVKKLTNPRATTFLAMQSVGEGKKVLSSLTLFAFERNKQPDSPEPMAWYLNGVFTLPEARRKGISSAVMAAAKQFVQQQAGAQGRKFALVADVLTANLEAKLFYEKMGFEVKSITDQETELIFEA